MADRIRVARTLCLFFRCRGHSIGRRPSVVRSEHRRAVYVARAEPARFF